MVARIWWSDRDVYVILVFGRYLFEVAQTMEAQSQGTKPSSITPSTKLMTTNKESPPSRDPRERLSKGQRSSREPSKHPDKRRHLSYLELGCTHAAVAHLSRPPHVQTILEVARGVPLATRAEARG